MEIEIGPDGLKVDLATRQDMQRGFVDLGKRLISSSPTIRTLIGGGVTTTGSDLWLKSYLGKPAQGFRWDVRSITISNPADPFGLAAAWNGPAYLAIGDLSGVPATFDATYVVQGGLDPAALRWSHFFSGTSNVSYAPRFYGFERYQLTVPEGQDLYSIVAPSGSIPRLVSIVTVFEEDVSVPQEVGS